VSGVFFIHDFEIPTGNAFVVEEHLKNDAGQTLSDRQRSWRVGASVTEEDRLLDSFGSNHI
jgi:hypothetical protein